MNTSDTLLSRVFPVQKEHTYDGVLTTFVAIGDGKTVVISQIEDQSLCIDLYDLEVGTVEELQGKKPIQSVELARPMPSGDELQVLAARYLTG
jgi:hypothetical protein